MTTTRTLLFDHPSLLGFERTRAQVERAQRTAAEGWPPFNVEALPDDSGVRISLAVAGFSADQLSVTVEGEQLTVTGRRDGEAERAFLHRGIAARGFTRQFVLAEGMEVRSADLEHGLLHIEVVRPQPPVPAVQTIPIRTAG
ncbi:MAG: Hsp20 family protein [Proteobacteria bacterium]|nr:Hsp20 family protein [Pseudomonadota bacterium]